MVCINLFLMYEVLDVHRGFRRNALILGILYMTFQAFPIIFGTLHGFNYQCTGLAFLGIGFGMLVGLASQPLWNRYESVRTMHSVCADGSTGNIST